MPALGVRAPVTLAVRAVLHRDEPASIRRGSAASPASRRGQAPPAASDAEGHTIGRPPRSQSCGCVNRNSQSTACTRRGETPSRGAAVLSAASSCPGTRYSVRQPREAHLRSDRTLSNPGVNRRNPVGDRANSSVAPLGRISFIHRDPPLGLDRDGQTPPAYGNGNFR